VWIHDVRDVREAAVRRREVPAVRGGPLRRRIVGAAECLRRGAQAGATIEVRARGDHDGLAEHILAGDAAGERGHELRAKRRLESREHLVEGAGVGAASRTSAAPAAQRRLGVGTGGRVGHAGEARTAGEILRGQAKQADRGRAVLGALDEAQPGLDVRQRGKELGRQAGLGADAREHFDQGRAATDGDPRRGRVDLGRTGARNHGRKREAGEPGPIRMRRIVRALSAFPARGPPTSSDMPDIVLTMCKLVCAPRRRPRRG